MATTPTIAAKAGEAVTESAKTATDVVVKTTDAAAAAVAPVVKAVEKTTTPVAKAAAVPVKAVKRAARVVKAKTAPVRKAAAKSVKTVAAVQPAPVKKAAKAVVTAARKVATPVQKDLILMATKFETPKMLTDMNDRAKAAMDKSGKLVSEMGDFSKGNVEALVESTRIAAKGMEAMGQDTADYARKSFEGMTATLKSLATVKSPTEFFKLQSDYARSAFDAAVAQSSKSTEMMIKLAGDAAKPISNRFALAAEKVKAAA